MKYEYKIVSIETSPSWHGGHVEEEEVLKTMHDLAKKDWEFVSAAPITKRSFFRRASTTDQILLFFKRQKNN